MFGLSRGKSSDPDPPRALRDTLFGDLPPDQWPTNPEAGVDEPWTSFVAARDLIAHGKTAQAIDCWRRILAMLDLESRHYLQAWHFLRQHGVTPSPQQAKTILGIVIEYPLDGGLDLLAAYSDHHARYYNHSGSGVVWEHPDDSLDPLIDALLAEGSKVLAAIGPWDKPRPPAPPAGQLRLNFLSPAGLHFGQGPANVLANDPAAKPTFDSATALMQVLIDRGRAS